MRCYIGDDTIKKRSIDIEAIDANDVPGIQKMKNSEIVYEENLGMMLKSKQSKLVRQSETERFITRYDAEFLKHFRGSLMKATRSKAFETAPRVQIMISGKLKNVYMLPKPEVVLVSAICRRERNSMLSQL